MIEAVNIEEKFALFSEHWRPKVVAELNGQELKLVKIKGEFPWHSHDVDEMFMVWRGQFRLDLRDRSVLLRKGEFIVVPQGTEHRPVAEEEAEILLIEPAGTRNTGEIEDHVFTAPDGARI